MSQALDVNLIELFDVPVVYFDNVLTVVGMNERFGALFGSVVGVSLSDLSDDFSEKKFQRRVAASQSYACTLVPAGEQRAHFTLDVKLCDNAFIGYAVDTSAVAKSEAMLASYSDLIEKQNREIKAKTEQLNVWRKRIQNELEQAETVQDLLVPRHVKTDFIDSRCEPLQELSGDFHEFVTHDDGQVTFISGDVAGKGIYAAIMLAQTLTAFRASFSARDLSKVAVGIVTMLEDRFPDGLFVALTLIRQSADKQSVSVLNLGNPDVLLLDDGGVCATVPSIGPAIGILPAMIYENLEASHHSLSGRRLYVFSDGVLDINLGRDHPGFNDTSEVAQHLSSLEKLFPSGAIGGLMDVVCANKQIDDVTIACFRSEPTLNL